MTERAARLRLRFLLPAGSETLSGGNLYNRALLGALREAGVELEVEQGPSDELPALLERGAPGVYLLDTLDLARAPLLAGRRRGQCFGLLVHHLPSLEPGLDAGAPELELERHVLPLFDFWVATSELTRELLVGRGFPRDRVVCVPPGEPELTVGPRTFVLPPRALVVGNLVARKAVAEWLTELAPRVLASDRFELTFAGRDDLEPHYAARCRALVAESPALSARVRFAGGVPHAQMGALYTRASLLVSPSQMETFGIALQEARAAGAPILALDRGNAAAHVRPGVNGRLAPNLPALADAFLELVRTPVALESLFRGAQSTRAPGVSWQRTAKLLVDAVRSLAAGQIG